MRGEPGFECCLPVALIANRLQRRWGLCTAQSAMVGVDVAYATLPLPPPRKHHHPTDVTRNCQRAARLGFSKNFQDGKSSAPSGLICGTRQGISAFPHSLTSYISQLN